MPGQYQCSPCSLAGRLHCTPNPCSHRAKLDQHQRWAHEQSASKQAQSIIPCSCHYREGHRCLNISCIYLAAGRRGSLTWTSKGLSSSRICSVQRHLQLSSKPYYLQLEMMVKRQTCVANLLSWSPKAGGRALDVLMCGLSGRGLTRRSTRALVNWELCKVTCELGPQHLT